MNLARRAGKTSAAGFVNAVLRGRLAAPRVAAAAAAAGGRRRSRRRARLPERHALASRAGSRRAGCDRLRLRRRRSAGLRSTTRRRRSRSARTGCGLTRDELAARLRRGGRRDVAPARFAPDGARRRATASRSRATGSTRGWFVVQDEASQLVPLLAGRDPARACSTPARRPAARRRRWPPPCAAAGLLVACDVRDAADGPAAPHRRAPAGATNVRLVQADAAERRCRSRGRSTACSSMRRAPGLGTLRRDPDIRWRRHGRRPAGARRRAARHAAARGRRAWRRAGGSSTPPARASPRRTRASSTRFSRRRPGSRPLDARVAAPGLPAGLVDEPRPSAHVPASARPRGVLRRGVRPRAGPRLGLVVRFPASDGPQNPRLERGQARRCSAARSSAPTCSSPPRRCASRSRRARCRCRT